MKLEYFLCELACSYWMTEASRCILITSNDFECFMLFSSFWQTHHDNGTHKNRGEIGWQIVSILLFLYFISLRLKLLQNWRTLTKFVSIAINFLKCKDKKLIHFKYLPNQTNECFLNAYSGLNPRICTSHS